jgi:hypothetical protein
MANTTRWKTVALQLSKAPKCERYRGARGMVISTICPWRPPGKWGSAAEEVTAHRSRADSVRCLGADRRTRTTEPPQERLSIAAACGPIDAQRAVSGNTYSVTIAVSAPFRFGPWLQGDRSHVPFQSAPACLLQQINQVYFNVPHQNPSGQLENLSLVDAGEWGQSRRVLRFARRVWQKTS